LQHDVLAASLLLVPTTALLLLAAVVQGGWVGTQRVITIMGWEMSMI
jgi:hypothetical protein